MQKTDLEWLSNQNPYITYTNTPDPTLVKLILEYGFMFDDQYWYWIPKSKGQYLTRIVKRSPLWTYPCKSIAAEKRKPYSPTKQQLLTVTWSDKNHE